MMKWTAPLHLFIVAMCFILNVHSQPSAEFNVVLEDIVTTLDQPVAGTHAGDGSGRLFLVEQKGVIRILQDGVLLADPFLDIRDRVQINQNGYDERGLLGLAFHPDYKNNGRFYVYYTAPTQESGANSTSVIAEYSVSDFSPNVAQSFETRLLTYSQPQFNHDGGQLAFGPDGMLYVASGDGGGANDQHGAIGNGQNLDTLLGKILRIDVDEPETYQIPADNPFVGADGMDEIWAYGLRNPWRFSFDHETGRLFCADVGQNKIEEVNIIERGGNYGWRLMEGSECFNPSNCGSAGLTLPIAEYSHATNRFSVTGGYVYRGRLFSSMIGQYIFADYGGDFFALEETAPDNWLLKEVSWELDSGAAPSIAVTSFVEDEDGELYVMYAVGDVFSQPGRLARVTVPGDEPASADDWQLYHSIYEEEI